MSALLAAASSPLARAVRDGLRAEPKRLPYWLLYDARGSALFEAITELPEYYPTRTERTILRVHAEELVAAAAAGAPLELVELGAGTARKTELLLAAAVELQGEVDFVPIDVSPAALAIAATIPERLPGVTVRPRVATYDEALLDLGATRRRRLVVFLGSSLGNLEPAEAADFLVRLQRAMAPGDALLLGADLPKDPAVLLPAYDDAEGVTAAFDLNVLARLHRELGADFDPSRFRHVARWDPEASRIEMHLESLVDQRVHIAGLGLTIRLAAGERIHTESSYKHPDATMRRMLADAGLTVERAALDRRGWFTVYLARKPAPRLRAAS